MSKHVLLFFYFLGMGNDCEWGTRTEFMMLISSAGGILEPSFLLLFVNRVRGEDKQIPVHLKNLPSLLKVSLMVIQTLSVYVQ